MAEISGHLSSLQGFPSGTGVKDMPASGGDAADVSSIPGLGISPREGNGNSLQHSCLKIPWTEEPGGLQSMGSPKAGHD